MDNVQNVRDKTLAETVMF